jgi:ADP-ribosylglycohydrolase
VVDLRERVLGCLLGGAIGDALGAPVENWHWRDIRERHGRVTELLEQPARSRDGGPGQITDDTTLRHYLCTAIVENGGRVGPEEYAKVWLNQLNPDRLYISERLVWEKLRLGMSPWDTGRGQLLADAAIMSIQPVGIINVGDPTQAYRDAVAVASIHQDGVERDAAATVAAGVSVALLPDSNAARVVATMQDHSTFDVRRLVDAGIDLADRSGGDLDHLAERFYATCLDRTFPTRVDEQWDPERSVAATSREVLPAVVAVLLACAGDPDTAIIEGASLGRDADTIATVIGCFVGALHGAEALRADWRATVESANSGFFAELTGDPSQGFDAMTTRLMGAIERTRRAARRRADLLDTLLTDGLGAAEHSARLSTRRG